MPTIIEKLDAHDKAFFNICKAADGLLDCLNEFAPEYPQACAERAQAVDDALAGLETAGLYERSRRP